MTAELPLTIDTLASGLNDSLVDIAAHPEIVPSSACLDVPDRDDPVDIPNCETLTIGAALQSSESRL